MHRKEHKNTHGAGSNHVKYKKEIKIFFYFFYCFSVYFLFNALYFILFVGAFVL